MTIIEKIKAEIERLKSIEYPCDNSQQATGFFNALDRMTDFLDTLESEKPTVQELTDAELDKEVELWYNEYAGNSRFDWIGFARHFAQWGAEHLKK